MPTEDTMAKYMTDVRQGLPSAKRSGRQTGPASPIQTKPVNHTASFHGTFFAPALQQYIHDVIDGKCFFDHYAADATWMRVLLAIAAIQSYFRTENRSDAVSLVKDLRRVLLELGEPELYDAQIRSFFEDCVRYLEMDTAGDTVDRTAGEDEELSESAQRIP